MFILSSSRIHKSFPLIFKIIILTYPSHKTDKDDAKHCKTTSQDARTTAEKISTFLPFPATPKPNHPTERGPKPHPVVRPTPWTLTRLLVVVLRGRRLRGRRRVRLRRRSGCADAWDAEVFGGELEGRPCGVRVLEDRGFHTCRRGMKVGVNSTTPLESFSSLSLSPNSTISLDNHTITIFLTGHSTVSTTPLDSPPLFPFAKFHPCHLSTFITPSDYYPIPLFLSLNSTLFITPPLSSIHQTPPPFFLLLNSRGKDQKGIYGCV